MHRAFLAEERTRIQASGRGGGCKRTGVEDLNAQHAESVFSMLAAIRITWEPFR